MQQYQYLKMLYKTYYTKMVSLLDLEGTMTFSGTFDWQKIFFTFNLQSFWKRNLKECPVIVSDCASNLLIIQIPEIIYLKCFWMTKPVVLNYSMNVGSNLGLGRNLLCYWGLLIPLFFSVSWHSFYTQKQRHLHEEIDWLWVKFFWALGLHAVEERWFGRKITYPKEFFL